MCQRRHEASSQRQARTRHQREGAPAEEQLDQIYESWKLEHNIGQDFNEAENLYRMKLFEQNLEEINTHNSLLGKSYEMGANRFSHLTKE